MRAKEGDVETGDAASELQNKILNDESMFIKKFVIPKFMHLQKPSKTEEKKMSLRDLLPVFIKSEEKKTTRDIPIEELKEEEKNTKNDGPVKLKRSNTLFSQIIKFIQDLPDWLKYAIAALAFIMYPMYRQLRKKEDEVQESVQSLLQVIERVAEVTNKLANDIAEALPSGNSLKGAVETVGKIAQKVDKDAETAQAFVKMIDDLGDELDEYINPLVQIGDAFVKDKVNDKKTQTESRDLELALDAKL